MARTKINDDEDYKEVASGEELNEETNEQVQESPEVAPKVATVVTTQAKKVRVRAVEEVSCMVANTPYHLAKDKEHLLPSDVAAILVNSGKVYRI